MRKEQQTAEVLNNLYELTLKFVRKLAPRYYKQYTGDLEDLASDFYCQFMTEKGRSDDKESLLDKYDPSLCPKNMSEALFFANLVKVSVKRLLIDRSRCNPYVSASLDKYVEDYGDSIARVFDLTDRIDESIDDFDITSLKPTLLNRIKNLTSSQIASLKSYYTEVRSVLNPSFQKVFDQVLNPITYISTTSGSLPLYQVTPKTVCLLYNGSVLDFDRFTGMPRKSLSIKILPSGIADISAINTYCYPCSRAMFYDKYISVYA